MKTKDIVARERCQNQLSPLQWRQLDLFPLANKRQKSHKRQSPHQSPHLQIASVPVNERIDPKEVRYVLIILPHGIRACGGQFTGDEAYEIARLVKGWDWTLDPNGRPYCLAQLEALLNRICKRSSVEGGEG
jgi:hypothetical protein